ncbi:hypothetical protein CDH05_22885 [Pseudomonas lactis]|nr:hypothetical protein CDH05_22885 [Pseudomonas lactis]
MLTFALFKSEPLSERNPKWPLPQQWICTHSNPTKWSTKRPPSRASPLPQVDRGVSGRQGSAVRPPSPANQLPHQGP